MLPAEPSRVELEARFWLATFPPMSTTLDWYGCATFRLRVAGLTVFLDAYIDRAPNAAGTGLTADDIDECDWIVVGHSHFDHLCGRRAHRRPHRRHADRQLRDGAGHGAGRRAARADDLRRRRRTGRPGQRRLRAPVYPSQHCCVWSHAKMARIGRGVLRRPRRHVAGAARALAQLTSCRHLATRSRVAVEHTADSAVGHSDRGDGGALVFLFETPEGSLLFQDTSGHWSGILDSSGPDVAILAAAGRGNVDGEPIQGSLAGSSADQAAVLGARRVVLAHHDDWLPASRRTDRRPDPRRRVPRIGPDASCSNPATSATPIFER